MLKKLFVILCGVLIATDSFATTDIAANAESSTCDSGVLGATQGDVNFDAKWESNNVKLRWYNNNTLMQGLAAASNTCDYDGTLTIPATEPQRVGYTFGGWHVMPTINASTLTSLRTGHERWGVGTLLSSGAKYCYDDIGTSEYTHVDCVGEGFSDIEKNEWKVTYTDNTGNAPTGTLYGMAYCSGKSGTRNDYQWNVAESFSTYSDLESASGTKLHCWCQATSWMASGSSTLQALSSLSSAQTWVFHSDTGSADSCARGCATRCVHYALANSDFRRALFVGAGQ